MNKLEEAKYIINRYDHYYDSINNKGNFYLVLNTFIIGGLLSGYYSLDKQYHFECVFSYLLFLTLLINVCSILFTLYAIKPFFSKRNGNKDKSLYYFGDVSERKITEYQKKFIKSSEKEFLDDATSQIHKLAIGLKNKFKKINIASILIGIQVLLILVFVLLLTIKY